MSSRWIYLHTPQNTEGICRISIKGDKIIIVAAISDVCYSFIAQ